MASTIKVDNVQNQPGTNIINKCSVTTTIGAGAGETVAVCAATVNLGRSGGTVNLTSGATQSGFGRTGTVDWITTPKVTGDSPITAVTGKGYFLNTTAGVITINLPAGAAGSIVSMADYAATWQTYNVTVSPNGSEKIGGQNSSVTLSTEGQSVTLVYVDAVQGWVNTMDSTSNVRGLTPFIHATITGVCNTLGTAPDCANTKIATFTGPGAFCVSSVSPCAANNLVSYMVAAGGGGGGSNEGGGGGGAGGFREYKSPVTPYTASPLDGNPGGTAITVSASPYPITVGAGGATHVAPTPGRGNAGNNSVFSTITSSAGGGGGMGSDTKPGGSGGSGGGGSETRSGSTGTGGAGNTPPVSPSQGQSGGAGNPAESNPAGAGGGGGAGAAGTAGKNPGAGCGGAGVSTSITGLSVSRAGGGGGGVYGPAPLGVGGVGGGGAGGTGSPSVAAIVGTVNTGGGGGGSGFGAGDGLAGGSGIVIIRYKFQ